MLDTKAINSAAARNTTTRDTVNTITFEQCLGEVRERLGAAIETMVNNAKYTPEVYNQITEETIKAYVAEVRPSVDGYVDIYKGPELNRLENALLATCLGYSVIDEAMHSPDVSEIQINDFNTIRIERGGKNTLLRDPKTHEPISFTSRESYRTFIDQLLMEDGKKLTETLAIIDSITRDGYRVNVIGDTATVPDRSGHHMYKPINCTIRKQPEVKFTAQGLVESGTMSQEISAFLEILPRIPASAAIVGATGAGKTVILQLLADNTPSNTRISAMGYPAELRLRHRDSNGHITNNVVHLEAREYTGGGDAPREFPTIANVNAANLRLTPELLIIEEIRRKEEFAFWVSAGNTGHTTYTSLHSRDAKQAATRIVVEYLAANPALTKDVVVEIIAGFLKFIIVQRKQPDGTRKIVEIAEICGWELLQGTAQLKMNMLFKYERDEETDWDDSVELTDEYLHREVIGKHYRVGAISREVQDMLRAAGFPKKTYEFLSKPLQMKDGKVIPEVCTYTYKPVFKRSGVVTSV